MNGAALAAERETHIGRLFSAELQFRLASAVRLATTRAIQPLDLPMSWTHGEQLVQDEELALRQEQADYAADLLHRSATYLMAVAMKDAIRAVLPDPKTSADPARSAYQIARLIRNAFAHSPFAPTWSIDPDCQNLVFSVPGVITLDTSGLHGRIFDWRHYAGPLALFRMSQLVRTAILGHQPEPRKLVPIPADHIYQVGEMVLVTVDTIPPDAVPVDSALRPDSGLDLGGGYVVRPSKQSD